MIKYTVDKAANGKSFIEAPAGKFTAGELVVIESHDIHAETPELGFKQRRKAIKAGEVEVVGTDIVEFKVVGVGEEFKNELGELRQRFYGE